MAAAFGALTPQRPADYVPWAPRGVSTLVWGPDLWRILHALSFLVTRRHAADVAALVAALGDLLPCKFCRFSWPRFVAALCADAGASVEEIVARGDFPRFLYDAHNLVNDKLMAQRLADAAKAMAGALADRLACPRKGVAAAVEGAAAAVPAVYGELDKRPSWECVLKRYYVAGDAPFEGGTVWRVLLLFLLNYDESKAPLLLSFLRVFARLLALVPAHASSLAPALARAADALERARATVVLDQRRVFIIVALAKAAWEGRGGLEARAPRTAYLRDLHTRIEVAAAGVCFKGVCK